MPVETRYLRSDTRTVDGETFYRLETSQSTASTFYRDAVSGDYTVYWGIRVWKRSADGTETEITGGSPVAVVSLGTIVEGIFSATWNCPGTSLSSTDAIVVRWYMRFGSGSWQLCAQSITEQLGASSLDAATWTVYYYVAREEETIIIDFIAVRTRGILYWGDSAHNTRIEGFSWTEAAVPVAAKRMFGDGLVWIVS